MFRGGGSAGGSSKRGKYEFIKSTPKFLQGFKEKMVAKENNTFDEKARRMKAEELSKKLNKSDFDYENAMIIDENNNVFKYEEVFGEGFLKSGGDDGMVISSKQKDQIEVKKIAEPIGKDFKPKFISKTAKSSQAVDTVKDLPDKKTEPEKEKTAEKGSEVKKESENEPKIKKRLNLNDVVENFKQSDSLVPKNKKVKGNLLSFNDD